jgi:hypothetical protein
MLRRADWRPVQPGPTTPANDNRSRPLLELLLRYSPSTKKAPTAMAKTSVPHATLRQNPFPAWYLRDGTMNAADHNIENASSSCGAWGTSCAVVVALSVVAEFVLVAIQPPYDSPWNRWGGAFLDPAVAIGIIGELIFSRLDARCVVPG